MQVKTTSGNLSMSHNPYFNRWFSAIQVHLMANVVLKRHNPYFNRWFSAIMAFIGSYTPYSRHNPYFNRWFSAIKINGLIMIKPKKSQSLF